MSAEHKPHSALFRDVRCRLVEYEEYVEQDLIRPDVHPSVALASLDSIEEQYRAALDSLRETLNLALCANDGDPWYAEDAGLDVTAISLRAQAVLQGWNPSSGAPSTVGSMGAPEVSSPASGERVATGEPSRTSTQGASQSPEESSPASVPRCTCGEGERCSDPDCQGPLNDAVRFVREATPSDAELRKHVVREPKEE